MVGRIFNIYRKSFTGLSRNTWLLSMVMLINRASTMVVPFMSMYLTQSLHRSIADAGLVITLFGVGSVLGTMLGGYVIDILGFRSVQIFTSLVGGILFMLFGMVTHFPVLCVLTLALSVVAEAFRPANFAAIASYSTKENLTRSYSLNRLATNLGWGLGISLGGILAAINYHLLFWVEGGAYMVICLLLILLLPPIKKTAKLAPEEEWEGAVPGELEEDREMPAGKKDGFLAGGKKADAGRRRTGEEALTGSSGRSPWKDPALVRIVVLSMFFFSGFIIIFRLVPVYWKETFHINERVIGLLLGMNGIIIAAFEMVLVRYWEGRRSKLFYIVWGMLATGAGFAFLIIPGIPPLLAAAAMIVLITVGEMLAVPFINSLVMSRSDASNRGKYSAAYALAWSVGQIGGPGGGALVVEKWGYIPLWAILVGLCLVCALAFKMQERQGRKVAVKQNAVPAR